MLRLRYQRIAQICSLINVCTKTLPACVNFPLKSSMFISSRSFVHKAVVDRFVSFQAGSASTHDKIVLNKQYSLKMIRGSSTLSVSGSVGVGSGGKDFVWKKEQDCLELKDVRLVTREVKVPETVNKLTYDVIKIDELLEVLDNRFQEITQYPFTMIVRKSYIDLYDQLTKAMNTQVKSTHLVTGVPGIGKSLFMLYFMYRYSRDPEGSRSFVLQVVNGKYTKFYFNEDGSLQKIDEDYKSPTRGDLLLVDLRVKQEPGTFGGHTIIFSSPNPDRYKEAIKGGTKFYMPTWTELEMHCAAKYKSSKNWFERFHMFGGVPRNVFHKGDPMNELELALEQKGSFYAKHYAESCGFMGPNPDEDYILVHINPRTNGTDKFGEPKYQYDEAVYRFASDAIEVRILEENKDWAFSSISNYLNNDQK